jgi:PAS domain S-box-containing protein
MRRFVARQIAVVTILPVVLIVALIWLFLLPQVGTNISIQQHALARTIAGEILAHLLGGERQLVALADVIMAEGEFTPAQLTTLLDAGCGEGELFETIYIVGAAHNAIDHIGLARSSRFRRDDLVGIDISGRELHKTAHQEMTTVWSETFLSTVSSQLAVAVAVPLPGRVIIGEITLNRLSEFISQLPIEAGLMTLVIDLQGRIVADSRKERWGQQLELSALPASSDDKDEIPATQPYYLGGVDLVASTVDVERLGWRVLVAQPQSRAFQSVQAMLLLVAAVLVIALIMSLGLAWYTAKRLADHVKVYTYHAKSIANGNYNLKWPVGKTIEYQELGESLKAMARRISDRERQLMASETHMRITLDSIGDGVITTDTAGVITRLNPVAATLTGWSTEDAIGQTLPKVFHIVDNKKRRKIENPVDRVLATGEIVGLGDHALLLSRGGSEYQIADSGAPIRHPDGKIAGVVLVFRDITERYRQARKIRESQRRLQELTANVPGVVYQFESSRNHRYALTYVSEKARDMFGLDPEAESLFDAFSAGLPVDERQAFLASIEEAVNAVVPWHYEGRFNKPGGEVIWFSCSAIPREEDDMVVFFGMVTDITQRKKVEESLRITQFSFDTAAIGIFRIDFDAGIVEANHEAARMLGYTREALSTMSIMDIDPNVDTENWEKIRHNLIDQGSDHFETIQRRKDGSEIVVEIHSNLLNYDDQQFAIAFAQDITERKRAEEELRQLRNYLSNIIDSMPSVLVGVDSRGRVSQWNRQAAEATGLPPEQARARPLEAVFPHLATQIRHLKTAIRDQRVIRDLKIPNNESGEIRYEDVTIFPLVTNGVEGAVIRVDDVTERVRLEEMMIQSEKMLSIGGLAAGMAHEINNPLAGILQNAAVLHNRLFEDLPGNRKAFETAGIGMDALQHYLSLRKLPEMVDNIRTSGVRATTIVKNMLSFARKSDRSVSRHDIRELLDKTIALVETDYDMKKKYDFKKIRILKEYEAVEMVAPCEASKIQQVFLNLLKNGAEAMATALAQAAEARQPPMFTLRVMNDGPWVRVEVEDNGPGMDLKTRRSVFEPFFTTKPAGKGTGLGLSVSYFIVTEDHGGKMTVEAAECGGARFVVRLPKSGREDV